MTNLKDKSRNRIYIEEVGRQHALLKIKNKEIKFLRKEIKSLTKYIKDLKNK
jgi:hypothetical protein|tara:strand:+ start:286 stop:441 length:156 start_codon:yes stop_codon:yes gene_type:complete